MQLEPGRMLEREGGGSANCHAKPQWGGGSTVPLSIIIACPGTIAARLSDHWISEKVGGLDLVGSGDVTSTIGDLGPHVQRTPVLLSEDYLAHDVPVCL